MSFVTAAPEAMVAAASDLARVGSTISAANTAVRTFTTGVVAAGADDVSAAVAALFSAHGQGYQALGAQTAALHDQIVQTLAAGAGSYASTEAATSARCRNC